MANLPMFTKHHGASLAAAKMGNHKLARHHVGKMLHALSDRAGMPTAPVQEGGEPIEPPAMPQPSGLRAKLAMMKPIANPTGGM